MRCMQAGSEPGGHALHAGAGAGAGGRNTLSADACGRNGPLCLYLRARLAITYALAWDDAIPVGYARGLSDARDAVGGMHSRFETDQSADAIDAAVVVFGVVVTVAVAGTGRGMV